MSANYGWESRYQDEATQDMHLAVLRERRDWLNARIDAKTSVGWDITWDRRERDALTWAIRQLYPSGPAS